MAKKPAKNTAAKNQQQQPAPQVPAQRNMVLVTYACFSFKNGNAIKAPLDNAEAGRAVLKDVLASLTSGKPYINEEKGIVFNPTELSHSFLAVEQVAQ